ncbi:MAG: hypothetical protein CMN87_19855 [Stappia sp.]|uniref:phage tail assembly chaperone n=1 Tax=Stappia sp. TaxID=1870903 RepID=UPI000C3D8BF1|nr:phage tail assembly chaperone [Stappia sp.]MAB01106.1 hypothetical protein [Stappia sp.]MBM22263.1 hypothetical protein [Stappia sp.]
MIHLCLARLGWSPEALWRATPREVALALGPPPGTGPAGPLGRERLGELMRRFPD